MSQFFRYPAAGTVTISAIGSNGASIPTSSIEVGAEDPSGNLQPLKVNSAGELEVSGTGGAGLATEATLQQVDTDVKAVNTTTQAMSVKLPATLGQKASAASLAVVIASDQSAVPVSGPLTDTQLRATAVPVSASALPLPTGAATSANQTTQLSNDTTMLSRLTGSLVPTAFNEVDLTYITSGNGTGQIGTAVYKLAGSTVKTVTLTYDASDRLSTVVAS